MSISSLVEAGLEVGVGRVAQLGGGDVASAWRCELKDGRTVFAKTKLGASPDFFAAEAWGLRWLADAAVPALAVPEVIHVGEADPLLVLEWIDSGPKAAVTDADFGRGLAELHRSGAPTFGRGDGRTTGSLGLSNEPCGDWAEFYATRRLVPLARIAFDRGLIDAAEVTRFESLSGRLGELGASDERPARLHGDLWAGNRLVDAGGRNWLIDPAAHGGHREFDLAMMALFGGWGRDAFAAYDEAWPLESGWVDRIELHQLAPLLVHAIKFGGSYIPATHRALARYL